MRVFTGIALGCIVGLAAVGLGATVGGNRAPDGTEVQCDLPVDLHRRNTTSRVQGCSVSGPKMFSFSRFKTPSNMCSCI